MIEQHDRDAYIEYEKYEEYADEQSLANVRWYDRTASTQDMEVFERVRYGVLQGVIHTLNIP